ncbi:MAG: Gfo/Idh/MocA family oxidoreductase [Pseudomonadota bacterium]
MNAAIVGLGWWGTHLCKVLSAKSTAIRVVRAVTPHPTPHGDLAAEIGFTLSSDLQDALDDDSVEGIIVTTPHGTHEENVLRAVAAGKQVFCEKPLALTTESAKRMVEACAARGLVLGVGHERRWEPAMEEVAHLVRRGALGTILHVEGQSSHNLFSALTADNWRGSMADAPAAGWTAMGVHLSDLFIAMLGPIVEVRALSAKRVLDLPSGDVVSAQLRFVDGTTGAISVVSATPFHGRLAVFGDKGWVEVQESAHVSTPGPTQLTLCDEAGKRTRTDYQPIDTVVMNLDAWAAAVAGKDFYRFTDQERIANVAVLEALAKSTVTGQAERVEA